MCETVTGHQVAQTPC